MSNWMVRVSFLYLLFPSFAQAGVQFVCGGTLISTIGADGPDTMTAIQAKFTLNAKDDGTATMLLENEYSPPLKGSGKESGKDDVPWNLTAKDEGGNLFKGHLTPIKPLMPQDTKLHMMLELKGDSLLINGPMTCEMK